MNHDYYYINNYDKDICSNIYIIAIDELNILFKNIPYKKINGPPNDFSYFKKIITYIIDIIKLFEYDEDKINNLLKRIVERDNNEIINTIDDLITIELNNIENNINSNKFIKKICLFSNILENLYMILHFFHFKSNNIKLNLKNPDKYNIKIYIDNQKIHIMKNCVTNFDYFNFVLNNGYQNLELWSQEGKKWLQNYPKTHPFFWKKFGDEWYIRKFNKYFKIENIFEQPVDNISYYEAEAYCNYKNGTLPTLYEINIIKDTRFYDLFVVGNVWEWTKSNIISETSLCFGGSKFNRLIIKNINDQIIIRKNAQHYFTGFRIVYKK